MLKVFVAAEPVHLGGGVPVDDITLLVLEIPWNDNEDISFSDPNSLFDLTFDTPKTCYSV